MLKKKYSLLGISFESIFNEIKDIVIKTLISIEPHVCAKITKTNTSTYQCFDLFGFDILVDEELKPWLLEVNMCPSLSSSAKLDKRIKTSLLCDTFHLIGMKAFSHVNPPIFAPTKDHTAKTSRLDSIMEELKEEELTAEDLEMLISFDEESSRTSESLQRIFPLKNNWKKYSKYFECKRYNNYLLWKCIANDCKLLNKFKSN